jgi:hypothetical protein
MKIDVTKLPREKIAWIWAYQEALRLLDKFDAHGLESAKKQWSCKTWESFVTTYGLRRGKFHPVVLKESTKVWGKLSKIFRPQLSQDCAMYELNCRWEQSVQVVGKLLTKRRDGNPPELWSMTSKLLWFFQPSQMTMYDDFAKNALRRHFAGRTLRRSEFLSKFEEFYSSNNDSIVFAESISNRIYPYHRRVADIRLWLKGKPNNEEEATLEAFRMSLTHAPFSKRQ